MHFYIWVNDSYRRGTYTRPVPVQTSLTNTSREPLHTFIGEYIGERNRDL